MASFTLLRSGAWRVQVRRKGAYAAETFLRKTDAQDWAREAELAIETGPPPLRPVGQQGGANKGWLAMTRPLTIHANICSPTTRLSQRWMLLSSASI